MCLRNVAVTAFPVEGTHAKVAVRLPFPCASGSRSDTSIDFLLGRDRWLAGVYTLLALRRESGVYSIGVLARL